MSLKEFRQKSSYSLNRSLTYDGPRRTTSPPGSPSRNSVPILGQGIKSPKPHKKSGGTLGYGNKKGPKIPKVPRPARTLVIFNSVKTGLRECIEATQHDIDNLQAATDTSSESTSAQARQFELHKESRQAERYKKRLEFHLSKIEELEENYVLQQQLREGAKTMAKAYSTLSGNNKKQSMVNVRHGLKECTQTMCSIEAELENMLGAFHCKMRGMVGFARLVPGDVFEVTLRHGQQKWKSRGRIKSVGQHWDVESCVFKALLGEVFLVKAVEHKSIAKSVILGQKNCDTKDLFTANPQMMTVNINATGSLKLSVVITWSPLEGIDDTLTFFEPPPKPPTTPKKRLPLDTSPPEQRHSSYISRETEDAVVISSLTPSPKLKARAPAPPQRPASVVDPILPRTDPRLNIRPQSTIETVMPRFDPQRPEELRPLSNYDNLPSRDSIADSTDLNAQKNKLFDMRMLADSLESTSPVRQEPVSLDEALRNLIAILEDYQGQYPDLQHLEEQVFALDRFLREQSGVDMWTSTHTDVSIEAALGAFDFLEKEEECDVIGLDDVSRLDQLQSKYTLSPESTTKTADSGIECLAQQLGEDSRSSQIEESSPSSPEPVTTGNEQVDQALLWHLGYCERLMENLGNFGPLKCRELYALDKLNQQGDIIEKLHNLAKQGSQVKDLQAVMSELVTSKELRQFWVRCVDDTVLYTTTVKFIQQLEKMYITCIPGKYDILPSKVFHGLCARILDIPKLGSQPYRLTLHQTFSYFANQEGGEISFDEHLQELAGELWINQRLKSSHSDTVIKTVQSFYDILPPKECLRVLALLLIASNTEIREAVDKYLRSLESTLMPRNQAMIVYVEALEDPNADMRCAACMALGLLKASESIDQLVYICQTDSSSVVRGKAKETLLSFGEEGQRAHQQVELSSHGFQGVRMSPLSL